MRIYLDDDPSHRQKVRYHLTEAAIGLVPVMAQLGAWGARWLETAPELTVRAELLAAGGPPPAHFSGVCAGVVSRSMTACASCAVGMGRLSRPWIRPMPR